MSIFYLNKNIKSSTSRPIDRLSLFIAMYNTSVRPSPFLRDTVRLSSVEQEGANYVFAAVLRPASRSVVGRSVGRSVAGNDDTSSGRVGSSHIDDDLAAAVQVTLPGRFKSRRLIARIHRARRNCNTKDRTRGKGGKTKEKKRGNGRKKQHSARCAAHFN